MDYEKKYKETIEKLLSFYKDYDTVSCLIDVKEEIANLFPELKESEDERIRQEILEYIDKATGCKEWVTWLKKQGEQKPVWSDEDEKIFSALSNALARISSNTRTDSTSINYSFYREIEWLKSIKNRVQPQQKQEWSEEDEKIINDLIQTISQYTVFAHREPKKIIQWLKSLKP